MRPQDVRGHQASARDDAAFAALIDTLERSADWEIKVVSIGYNSVTLAMEYGPQREAFALSARRMLYVRS